MELQIPRADLARELGLARRVSERKTTIPVYAFTQFSASAEGFIDIAATDGECAFYSRLRSGDIAQLEVPSLLLPTKTLHEIAKAATGDVVRIAVDGKAAAKVTCGNFKSSLQVMPSDDFPQLPAIPEEGVELHAKTLITSMGKTRFVVDSTAGGERGFVFGASFSFVDGKFVVVATDGRRLAVVKTPCEGSVIDTIVPRKTMDDLVALLSVDDGPETVRYGRQDARVYFVAGSRTLVSRTIDGVFPPWGRIVPKVNAQSHVDADRDIWLAALKRVSVLASEQSTKLRMTIEKGQITVALVNAQVGEASETLAAELMGDGWEAAFGVSYVTEFLNSAEPGSVRLSQSGPRGPGLFESSPGSVEHTYVLMPMDL